MIDVPRDDAALLASFLDQRSEVAFAELVERHGGMVAAVCRRMLGNGADADDAAQATFLVLSRRALSLRGRPSLASWLHEVARHVALNTRRSIAARAAREREAAEMMTARSAPSEEAAWSALRPLLDREIAALPERYRAPLILFHLEGRSLAETAAQVGRPVGTVGSALSRGRELLRRRLERAAAVSEDGLARGLEREFGCAVLPVAVAAALPKAALAAAAGQAAGVSAQVTTLADGGAKALQIAKLKVIAACAAALAGSGALAAGAMVSSIPSVPAAVAPSEPIPATVRVDPPRADPPAPAKDERGLADDSWTVRLATIKAMAMRGGGEVTTAQAGDLADDPVWSVREAFIGAIPDLRVAPETALAAVERGLDDQVWSVRFAAAETAGLLGPSAAGLVPRLRKMTSDKVVSGAARWALRQIVSEPEVPLAQATAARIAELSPHLGAGWTIDEIGKGLVVASKAGVTEMERLSALGAYDSARRDCSRLVPEERPLTRPVVLLLVHRAGSHDCMVPGEYAYEASGYDSSTRVGLADVADGDANVMWAMVQALLHQDVGWDERGSWFDGVSVPYWLQQGIVNALIYSQANWPSGATTSDLRREQLRAWMRRTGLYRGPVVDEMLASVPADAPAPTLSWLLSLDYEAYVVSSKAPGQFSDCLARALVRYLHAEAWIEPYYRGIQTALAEHRSRLVRAWDTPGVAARTLVATTGLPLDELQRRLFAWVAAGEPGAPAANGGGKRDF